MNKNALFALTALNTAGLVAVGGVLVTRTEPGPTGSRPAAATGGAASSDDGRRIAQLEERLARLEGRAPAVSAPASLPGAGPASSAGPAEAGAAVARPDAAAPGATPIGSARPDAPVTRAEVEALIGEQLAKREAIQAEKWKAAYARPKKALNEVARELGLDARQENAVREQYRQLERDSMKLLFEVDDAGLETLKAQLAQAEHDPRLKEQLRERLSINWTRRQSDIGVLWVKVDARLREQLGPELLQRFYGFDAQLEEREFPDMKEFFYADPKSAESPAEQR